MDAQTFWAPTVSEAMKQVAIELGGNAMIVSTEETSHPSQPGRRLFCVTAVPGQDDVMDYGDLMLSRSTVAHEPLTTEERRTTTQSKMMEPEQIELFGSLLNQLQVLQTELIELRTAREDWERTTKLCRDLRAEVQSLSLRMDQVNGVSRGGVSSQESTNTASGTANEGVAEVMIQAPLWESDVPTLAMIMGPRGSGKTLTTAKIAAEASALGKTVALVDCTGSGHLERLGNRIGIPTWNVPSEGNLEQVLSACSGLDLVLLDLPVDGAEEICAQVELTPFRMEVHMLTVIPANWDEKSIENVLQSADKTDAIALTKLDETKRIEGILVVIKNSGYPVSHVCTGKKFPGDIRPAKAGELNAETRAA